MASCMRCCFPSKGKSPSSDVHDPKQSKATYNPIMEQQRESHQRLQDVARQQEADLARLTAALAQANGQLDDARRLVRENEGLVELADKRAKDLEAKARSDAESFISVRAERIIAELKAKNEALQVAQQVAQADLKAKNDALTTAHRELDDFKAKNDALQAAQQAAQATETTVSMLRLELDDLKAKNDALHAAQQAAQATEVDDLKAENDTLHAAQQAALSMLHRELDEERHKAAGAVEAAAAEAQRDKDALTAELDAALKALDAATTASSALITDVSATRASSAELQQQLNAKNDEIAGLRRELVAAAERAAAEEHMLEEVERLQRFADDARLALDAKVRKAEARAQQLQTDLDAATAALTDRAATAALTKNDAEARLRAGRDREAALAFERDTLALEVLSLKAQLALQTSTGAEAVATKERAARELEEEYARKLAAVELDRQRIADLQEVNDRLRRFARDRRFQELLATTNVQLALECWAGANIAHVPPARLEEVKHDPGVKEIYPALKEFEEVCNAFTIKFPIDHLIVGAVELSKEAVTYAFGPDFVALHHLDPSSFQGRDVIPVARPRSASGTSGTPNRVTTPGNGGSPDSSARSDGSPGSGGHGDRKAAAALVSRTFEYTPYKLEDFVSASPERTELQARTSANPPPPSRRPAPPAAAAATPSSPSILQYQTPQTSHKGT